MKTCSKCGVEKGREEFYAKSGQCKACYREYQRDYYARNGRPKQVRTPARVVQQAAARAASQQHVWSYLLSHPCTDCGESDPVVLEFDHLRDKEVSISKLVRDRAKPERLDREIAKCEVVCANCHRRRTYMRADSWRVSV